MRPLFKEPTNIWKNLYQFMIEGFLPVCAALPPVNFLPDGRQVTVSCHPTRKAKVEKQEGCEPPFRSGG